MGTEDPVTLGQLPRPLSATDGLTRFGPCYGLKGSRKRRRLEVAAAIDGETLNIYNIQRPTLLCSYAVPPTTSFTCQPCSIRVRLPQGSITVRHTVCVTSLPTSQILCFKETVGPSDTPEISTYKFSIADDSPAIYADFVPATTARGQLLPLPDIVIVHRDGTVRQLSGDLQELRWVWESALQPESRTLPCEVFFAQWISYPDARASLLASRGDILNEARGSSFLVLVYRDGDHQELGLQVGVFELPTNTRTGLVSTSSGRRLRLLVSSSLPESKCWIQARDLRIDLHAQSARLSISSRNKLINYDLSAHAPAIHSKITVNDGHSSLLGLTSHFAAGAMRAAVQIYDMDYRSVQARYDLSPKSRQNQNEVSGNKSVRFISYFAKIETLVAVRGRSLVSFDLSRVRRQNPGLAASRVLLLDTLGRSTVAGARLNAQRKVDLGPGFAKAISGPNQLEKAEWLGKVKKLDKLVQEQRIDDFERLMAEALWETSEGNRPRMETTNLLLPSADRYVRYEKLDYLLSKIFKYTPHTPVMETEVRERDLVIEVFPPRLFQWLTGRGHLSTSHVQSALFDNSLAWRVDSRAVANSIMEQDPSLGLLNAYLQGPSLSGLDEIVMVVKALVQAAVAMVHEPPVSKQLPLASSHNLDLEQQATNRELVPPDASPSSSATGGWTADCVTALNTTLAKLQGFPPNKIEPSIRTHLAADECLALIQFLRQQIFRSGHTSSFPNLERELTESVLSLDITASLLSSCVDAIGPLGFLGSQLDETLWNGIVPDLKVEISLALASIEEATYLKGVLQEMLRYGNATAKIEAMPIECSSEQKEIPSAEPGTIVRVYSEHGGEGDGLDGQASFLPLSLTLDSAASKTKKRKGGGEVLQRSGRELQYLKNLRVGNYSFERLVL